MTNQKSDQESIAEHARITQAILSNSFLNGFDRTHVLFEEPTDDKGGRRIHKTQCVGSFAWQRHMENNYAKMVAFPIFFDLLDLHVDIRFECADSSFSKKIKILEKKIDHSQIFDLFLLELYTFCSTLRNKIIHHKISHKANEITYSGTIIKLERFKIINELIYQYVTYGFKDRPWYHQNSMLSYLYSLIGRTSIFSEKVEALDNFTNISTSPERYRHILHNKYKYTPNDYIIDFVFTHAGSLYEHGNPECNFRKTHPDPDEKIVFGARYYFILLQEKYYLFPSELIMKNREIKFSSLTPWRYELRK